ncbi:hypothetical protein MFS40622_1706 [Methanocaldococcus sp. FS406-22]|uniref:hypothetical protein n=1 Tax=Methanocaldococcus sp. (strain FS406-22) TaxID=644281 RepID=UPI0001BF3E8C|nr:hypothetical protein [Methanocaldococcus sp. FS406-22]ADC70377.1 hypothetical protein MFS40622_1706 [Methanocaldococcus sp. FS406-22]
MAINFLRKELATKEDILLVKTELLGEIKIIKLWIKILVVLIVIFPFIPEVLKNIVSSY